MAVPDLSPIVPMKVHVALVFAVPSACVTVTACPEQVPTKVPVAVKADSYVRIMFPPAARAVGGELLTVKLPLAEVGAA
jgi:hypothetical protein